MSDTAFTADPVAAVPHGRERVWPSARQCKWIDGDPKRDGHWRWCLAPVDQAGGQYCAHHMSLVYMPARSR